MRTGYPQNNLNAKRKCVGFLVFFTVKRVEFRLNNLMFLPVEPGRLIEGPVNPGRKIEDALYTARCLIYFASV